MLKPQIKAIVLDIDDTLLDTSALRPRLEFLVGEALLEKAQEHLPDDSWLKVATPEEVFAIYRQMYAERGANAQDHINHLLSIYGVEEPALTSLVQFAVDTYHKKRDEWLKMYVLPGVEEVVPWLRSKGVVLAALSNGSSEKQKEKLNYIGIDGCFDAVLTSEEIARANQLREEEAAKPNRAAYVETRKRLAEKITDLTPDNILYIDDRLDHLAGAALAGWNNSVHMRHGKYANQTVQEISAKLKVPIDFARPKHSIGSFVEIVTAVLPHYSLKI